MADMRKDFAKIDKMYMGSDHILGKNILTLANRINSSRGLMFSSELDQAKVLKNPQRRKMFTGYEKVVGKYSSAYYEAQSNYKVIDKIVKFPENENAIYTLIIYDIVKKEYDIISRVPGVVLTETYGYKYNNDVLDSLKIGQEVDIGDVLFKSTSFDEDMNYMYGINAQTAYLVDPDVIEDPIKIRRGFAEKCDSIEYDNVKISLNDNDILINMYGDRNLYKAFPDIGEEVKDATIAVKRRLNYAQSFFDLKEDNMRRIMPSDTPYYIPFSKDKIVDINVYCNKNIEDIEETPYNRQILNYLDLDRSYNEEISDKLGKIIESGKKYTDDLAELYSRSTKAISPDYPWTDSDKKVFSNIIIEFFVEKEVSVVVGSKFCGLSGDEYIDCLLTEVI